MSTKMAKVAMRTRQRVRAGIAALVVAPIGLATVLVQPTSASRALSASTGLSAKECAANRAAGTVNWVSPFGFTGSATILDIFAAQSLGFFKDMCLTVNLVTNSYTPEELVSSGAAQFTSEGSAADFLLSAENGANVVAIATDGDESNYALLTQSSITKLSQLAGKSVGYHQSIPVVISEMLAKAGVLHSAQFVEDNSYDPTLLTRGTFDAIQAYQSNEPLTLRGLGLKFNEFKPNKFGVKGTMDVTVVNGSFLRRYPSASRDFMRADLEAFHYCLNHALTCVNLEEKASGAAGVPYSYEHEYLEWKTESTIAVESRQQGLGIGVETEAEWKPEATALVTYRLAKHPLPLTRYENTSLTASLYDGTDLIWP